MKRFWLSGILLLSLAAHLNADQLRAFPTAEGFGARSEGGRGGIIVFVSNLNDSGSGSLRAAVELKKPPRWFSAWRESSN